MRIFLWHVHGSWTTAFVQGGHQYFVPVLPGRPPDGRGRARTWDWPASVTELTPREAAVSDFDVVVLQRPEELAALAEHWLGRVPGRQIPAVYLEHNAPEGDVSFMRHPAADRRDLRIVHVSHFNNLFWDAGATPTTVIEHGIVEPAARYSGEIERAAVVINEPMRRGRIVGTDLVLRLRQRVPIEVFGMDTAALGGVHLVQDELHRAMAARRVYLHPIRWTSLGLSLIEAMQMGMPVVALATTEVADAVPSDAGVVSNRLDVIEAGIARLVADPEEAAERGARARAAALERYGLQRFLDDWDLVLKEALS